MSAAATEAAASLAYWIEETGGPHALDRIAGCVPMSGTIPKPPEPTKLWPAGAFPRNAMRSR